MQQQATKLAREIWQRAGLKKTPLGTVWDVPAGLKEAIQLPAQHRLLQLPGLRGGQTERRQNSQRIEVRRPRCSEANLTIQTYVKLT